MASNTGSVRHWPWAQRIVDAVMMPSRSFVGGVADGQKVRLLRKQRVVFVHVPPAVGYQEYVRDGGTFFAAGLHRQIPWNAPIARPR